ncbi:MAG: hypothetical protein FVQ79_00660 [Planctomycetes bacterium]|nr:hypothetical protein [Planctomycetota bacterium]
MSKLFLQMKTAFLLITLAMVFSLPTFAGPMSDYLENEIIDYWFQNTVGASKPATLYFGLSTAACSDTGFGTEVTGGSYARVTVTANATNFPGPTTNDGTIDNASAITFPAPTANWGLVTHWFIADAVSAGNLLWCQALTTSKTINNGDAAPSFGASAMSVQVDN